jgi:AraC-like DNA-binding protein
MSDAFSDVLRLIQLKSCVYFLRDFSAPWGMQMQQGEFAQFHAVMRGQCAVTAAGQVLQGAPGDIFLFPGGLPHVISDVANGDNTVPGEVFMQSLASDAPLFSQSPAATQLLCGHYEFHRDFRHPLFEELPPIIHVKSATGTNAQELPDVIRILVREMSTSPPGTTAVIERLAEILLIQVIRANLQTTDSRNNFAKGLSDPRLARAIQLIHQQPERRLKLGDLAAEAGMSRSAFAFHFRVKTGTTPSAYLTLWRMCLARGYLQDRGLSVTQSAHLVGYESEVAFNRAFRRHFGISPGKLRAKSA